PDGQDHERDHDHRQHTERDGEESLVPRLHCEREGSREPDADRQWTRTTSLGHPMEFPRGQRRDDTEEATQRASPDVDGPEHQWYGDDRYQYPLREFSRGRA